MADKNELMAKCEALPPRVKVVLRGFAKYQRPKEIARDLDISVHTVRSYEKLAREKLGVRSTLAAALLFRDFEALTDTPNSWGHHNQRVSPTGVEEAASSSGFAETYPLGVDESAEPTFESDAVLTNSADQSSALPSATVDHMQNDQLKPGGQNADITQGLRQGLSGLWLHGLLTRLTRPRWLFAVLVLGLVVIAAFGIGLVGLLGIFEILQQIGGPRR